MDEEKVITGLTIIIMGALVSVVVGLIVGLAWRFILAPLFLGGC